MTVDGEPLVFFAHGDERRAEARRRLEASGLDVDAAAVAAGLALRDFLDATGDLMTWAEPSQGERANALVAALRRVQRAGCEGSTLRPLDEKGARGGATSPVVTIVRDSGEAPQNRFQRRRAAAQKRRAR